MATRKGKNPKLKVQKNPTPANRKMNTPAHCVKNPTPANRKMNAPAKVSPKR